MNMYLLMYIPLNVTREVSMSEAQERLFGRNHIGRSHLSYENHKAYINERSKRNSIVDDGLQVPSFRTQIKT